MVGGGGGHQGKALPPRPKGGNAGKIQKPLGNYRSTFTITGRISRDHWLGMRGCEKRSGGLGKRNGIRGAKENPREGVRFYQGVA